MNCDEAFDALTHPDFHDDSALKWHLEMCPRCREMQKVLAPALGLFSGETELQAEAPGSRRASHRLAGRFPEETNDSPTSEPFLTPEAVRLAEETANALKRSPRRRRSSPQRWVAVGLIGVLAIFGLFFGMPDSDHRTDRQQTSPVIMADQCLWTNRDTDRSASRHQRDESSSRSVVLSCVACHLERSLD